MVITSQLIITLAFVWTVAMLGWALWRRFGKKETTLSGKPWPDNFLLSIDVITVFVFGFLMVFSWLHAANPFQ